MSVSNVNILCQMSASQLDPPVIPPLNEVTRLMYEGADITRACRRDSNSIRNIRRDLYYLPLVWIMVG